MFFLYISLSSMHDYDMNMDMNTRQRLLESNSRKNCQHWTNYTRWNKPIKFEAAQLYLLSDVFVAVAVAVVVA